MRENRKEGEREKWKWRNEGIRKRRKNLVSKTVVDTLILNDLQHQTKQTAQETDSEQRTFYFMQREKKHAL